MKWKGTCADLSNTHVGECLKIAGVPNSIIPSRRTSHFNFREARGGNEANGHSSMCHRLGETGRAIVKLLNRKDAQNV